MDVMTVKGEKKVSELVSRAYGNLKMADAKRAEAAILRANPHLENLRALPRGTVVVVPAVPGVRAAATSDSEIPTADAIREIRGSVDVYQKKLNEALSNERAAVTALGELLKSKELKAAMRESPDAAKYVERATAAAKSRAGEVDVRAGFVKGLSKARADLEELAKKLE